jgi:predicted transcriptional regulator
MLTLRLRDNWIRLFGDHETALIALAVVVITSERLTRTELDADRESLAIPLDPDDLARCNISSVASATGLNRETTRRKIDQLVRNGLIMREDGSFRLTPGFTQQSLASEIVKTQLDELRRAVNDLLRIDAIDLTV